MKVHFEKLLKTETGRYIISLLLGLGLASFFRYVCKEKDCLNFIGPHVTEVKDKVYKNGDKCYKYIPRATECSSSKKIINFSDNAANI